MSAPPPSVVTRLGRWVGPIALAAAILVVLRARGTEDDGEVPAYAVAAPGARVRTTGKGSRFELELRPDGAPTGKVAAWVFTLREGSDEPTPLAAKVEISPAGAVRIRGAGEDLDRVREIRVVVASATSGTKFDAAATRAQSGASDARIRVLTVVVEHAAP